MISPIKDMDTISESLLIDGKLDLKMRTAQQCLQKKKNNNNNKIKNKKQMCKFWLSFCFVSWYLGSHQTMMH
jgi:hypothetical protein